MTLNLLLGAAIIHQSFATVVTEYAIGNMGYDSTKQHCESIGAQLASADEIKDYLDNTGIGGDSWAPVSDDDNEWMQIGGSGPAGWSFGELHSNIQGGAHGKPAWGEDDVFDAHTHRFYCSGEPRPPLTQYDIGNMGYDASKQYCDQVGQYLASAHEITEYLQDGIGGDSWAPVSDDHNEWVQIGGSGAAGWSFGELHSEVQGGFFGKPEWGEDNVFDGHTHRLYCSATAPISEYDIGSMGYDASKNYCESNGQELASADQIRKYLGDGIGGDLWAPVSNQWNEWVQIGGAGTWSFGELHTEIQGGIHGTPQWGKDNVYDAYTKTLYCSDRHECSCSPENEFASHSIPISPISNSIIEFDLSTQNAIYLFGLFVFCVCVIGSVYAACLFMCSRTRTNGTYGKVLGVVESGDEEEHERL